jgi:hypothetical protein
MPPPGQCSFFPLLLAQALLLWGHLLVWWAGQRAAALPLPAVHQQVSTARGEGWELEPGHGAQGLQDMPDAEWPSCPATSALCTAYLQQQMVTLMGHAPGCCVLGVGAAGHTTAVWQLQAHHWSRAGANSWKGKGGAAVCAAVDTSLS